MKLNPRHRQILWATVKHYINTAEPVGSKMLVEAYQLELSSASIRNAMNALEQAGLLFQPHTSAGRVPSDSGYRVYVDELLAPSAALTREVREVVLKHLDDELHRSLESLLERTARLLAMLTGCVALITAPVKSFDTVRHLRLVPVSEGRALLVLVADTLQTYSLIVTLPAGVATEDLDLINNFLNTHCSNCSLQDLSGSDDPLWQEFRQWTDFLRGLVGLIREEILVPQVGQIFVSGLTELMRQPEYSQPQRLQELIGLLEEERVHLAQLLKDEAKPRTSVRIGTENPLTPMHGCSLVSRTFSYQGLYGGSVSVLGPTRLPYDRAIASVEATADHLSTTVP
ncbi:heat-inducible transcriptional repressor HrcA [Candidatus Cyanaurora vandensis]|uniref:heat-inducible transcriptional repressor HrcA n=1 Tax=Candidatus Cyanaurora vandensis TaxID=2714958 RepID=UPI00257E54C0|nr:heat-inducible transcriptional repressor HrcA [Candidatus Cyanaurora vandensis]